MRWEWDDDPPCFWLDTVVGDIESVISSSSMAYGLLSFVGCVFLEVAVP